MSRPRARTARESLWTGYGRAGGRAKMRISMPGLRSLRRAMRCGAGLATIRGNETRSGRAILQCSGKIRRLRSSARRWQHAKRSHYFLRQRILCTTTPPSCAIFWAAIRRVPERYFLSRKAAQNRRRSERRRTSNGTVRSIFSASSRRTRSSAPVISAPSTASKISPVSRPA